MGYKSVYWLLRPEDCAYSRLDSDVCFLLPDTAYQYLEHLLQLSEEALYKLTFHRFFLQMQAPEEIHPTPPAYLQRPLFLLKGHSFRKLFLPQTAARVCPRCLAEEPACGVLYWNIGPVVTCLKHHIFLVDCCPHCQGKIPRLRSVLTHCPRCSGDYRLASTVHIPDEPLFLLSQARILNHLGVVEAYRGDMPTVYGESQLQGLLAWQYFQLLYSFRNVLDPFFPNHQLLQTVAGPPIPSGRRVGSKIQLSLGEWASFMLTFCTIFTSWPDNFTALLEFLPSVRSCFSAGRRGPVSDFGVLYYEYLYKRLRDPAFAFLREAFEHYLKKQFTGGRVSSLLRPFIGMESMQIATECTYLTQDQAMKLLGVHKHNLHALINRGAIRAQRNPVGTKGKMSLWLVEREDVEALLEEWKDLLPIEALAQAYLGVTMQQVLALTRAGLLHPTRGPGIDRYITWCYKSDEIKRLKSILLQYACKDVATASKCIPLSNSARITGLPLVETVKEILSGHLLIIDTEREIPLFQRFVLSTSEVKRFLVERLKAERSDLNLLSANDVMERLGVGEVMLKKLLRQGVLVGKNQIITGKIHGLLFQKEMVDSFCKTYVFAKEAAELLNVTSSAIRHYASMGILHPVGPLKPKLFLREEVEALIPPHKLSIPQAAALLDLTVSKLYALIQARHIAIVRLAQCPEKKWLFYSDVERLRDEIEK